MSRLAAVPTPQAMNSCGPCLTEKQRKKQDAERAKELKDAINSLVRLLPYIAESQQVMGSLLVQLIQLQGPLK